MTTRQDTPRTPRSRPSESAVAGFAVPTWMHRLGGWQHRHPQAAIRLGNFDTRVAGDAIARISVDRPIYIAGIACAGTTIVLETLAAHPAVGTHQYRDFPPVMTPWLWDRWLARVPQRAETAAERAHGDGIAVTSRSPEAFEEVVWMAFFDAIHDPRQSNVLDRTHSNPEFERFYSEHIRKLLAIRGASRYASKGNYNLMRLAYLQTLFADARFVLLIRDPVWHIASLIKQQTLFEAGETAHPRALEHMRQNRAELVDLMVAGLSQTSGPHVDSKACVGRSPFKFFSFEIREADASKEPDRLITDPLAPLKRNRDARKTLIDASKAFAQSRSNGRDVAFRLVYIRPYTCRRLKIPTVQGSNTTLGPDIGNLRKR